MSEVEQPCPSHAASPVAWSLSVLNALVGDHLRERHYGLAVTMGFFARNRPLRLTHEGLLREHPQPTGRVAVFVHGLGCHEGIWAFRDPAHGPHATSFGARLQADLGYTPLFVRYNTGLSIARNGAHLSVLLEELRACYPRPLDELVLVGHSMGGLVIGAAGQAAGRARAGWLSSVRRVICLGTPREGAPLAQLAHLATTVLHAVPNPITRLIGQLLDLRSLGLKELRGAERAGPAPWPAAARHYRIGGMLNAHARHPLTVLLGDGLVGLPGRRLWLHDDGGDAPAGEHVRLFPHTHHLRLPRDAAVYAQIRHWCESR